MKNALLGAIRENTDRILALLEGRSGDDAAPETNVSVHA